MRNSYLYLIFFSILLTACATSGPPLVDSSQLKPYTLPQPLYTPGHGIPSTDEIFALPEEAKVLLNQEFRHLHNDPIARMAAFEEWMAQPNGFYVEYDNATTYVAAETFDARAGNCLSLAILTAAFSRYLDFRVKFLRPDTPEFWEQRDGLEAINDHVNVAVRAYRSNIDQPDQRAFLVDFTSSWRSRYVNHQILYTQEVLSLFYRNRAAEALVKGDLEMAYSYAYQVKEMMPKSAGSYSLLGLVLRRQGHDALAEQVYLNGLVHDSSNPYLLHNLVYFYRSQGRENESQPFLQRLESLQLKSPFIIAREAESSYREGDYSKALALYKRAIRKADYIHDFHFGKAKALFSMGDYKAAKRALTKAKELSTTRQQGLRYSGKLAALSNYL